MNVIIHAVNFPLNRSIRKAVEQRLHFSLRRYGDQLQKIVIRLWSAQGHSDKRCQVQARIAGQQDIIIDHSDRNLHAAIYRSVERASGTIMRRLKRQQTRQRQRPALTMPSG